MRFVDSQCGILPQFVVFDVRLFANSQTCKHAMVVKRLCSHLGDFFSCLHFRILFVVPRLDDLILFRPQGAAAADGMIFHINDQPEILQQMRAGNRFGFRRTNDDVAGHALTAEIEKA